MNEFERKLRQQAFRPPPADLRAALFDTPSAAADPEPAASWKWRDWFWPSPHAWGALVALWAIFAAFQWFGGAPPPPPPGPFAEQRSEDITLLAFHTPQELHHALDSLH